MTTRYNYFSHVENLTSQTLVLFDPFAEKGGDGIVCRYELHRAPPSVLEPDSHFLGISSWHALLPVPQDRPLPDEDVLDLEPVRNRFTGQCASLERILPAQCLPEVISRLMAEGSNQPDFDVWGNPFRLEGLKLVGLELMHRFAGQRPALVVFDPTGELVFALELASSCYRALHRDVPFRTILVQQQPLATLCALFEGSGTDSGQTPQPIAQRIMSHLTSHMGTAIAVPQDSEDPFEPALEILVRTGFIDDEDPVLLL